MEGEYIVTTKKSSDHREKLVDDIMCVTRVEKAKANNIEYTSVYEVREVMIESLTFVLRCTIKLNVKLARPTQTQKQKMKNVRNSKVKMH